MFPGGGICSIFRQKHNIMFFTVFKSSSYLISLIIMIVSFSCTPFTKSSFRSYHFDNHGSDDNGGSFLRPFRSLAHISTLKLSAGDTLYFAGGQVFEGSIFLDSTINSSASANIVISSYGDGKATIQSGNFSALTLHKVSGVSIKNLRFEGAGRKSGNTSNGVIVNESSNITIDSIIIKGFQKSGLLVYASKNIEITKVRATENGTSGIYLLGVSSKTDCRDIRISRCTADNNPGDPTNFTNHSGNGILAGLCTNVTIEYCTATNNGWDMPRKGNGPVGIWCYESDSVLIQHCISYKNKTAPGAGDGGGFDLDGGVTNSTIQYCLSYENDGAGFGIFQYAGASSWYNNTIRYNISENDGQAMAEPAGISIWNSADDSSRFKNLLFYNNTIYNYNGAAIRYDQQSMHSNFGFFNNIFVSGPDLISGQEIGSRFIANNWYSLQFGFKVSPYTSFEKWISVEDKEQVNDISKGINEDPEFKNINGNKPVNPDSLFSFFNYRLPEKSVLRTAGIALRKELGIEPGNKTINLQQAPLNGIGASF